MACEWVFRSVETKLFANCYILFISVVELRKKVVRDDTDAPKAPKFRRRVLHGVHNRSGGMPPSPGSSSTGLLYFGNILY